MIDKVLEELKNSSFFNEFILADRDVICVFVAGSRLIGINDETADYDINVLTNGGEFVVDNWCLQHNPTNSLLHWYVNPYETYFNMKYEFNKDLMYAKAQMYYINKDSIIYINPKYEYIIDEFLNKCKIQGKSWIRKFAKEEMYKINNFIYKKQFSCDKIFITLIAYSYALNDEQLDVDFIKYLRENKKLMLNDYEVQNKVIDRLKILKRNLD